MTSSLQTHASNITTSSDFSPNTNLDNNEILAGTDFFYAVKDSWVKDLGFSMAFLFSMIISLSQREGYCFMKDKTFAQRLRVSERTIERWMHQLEEKNYIYRNSFNGPGGKKRHIVTKDNFLTYWEKFLNRPCIPDSVKKDYLKKFITNSSNIQKKPTRQKTVKKEPPDTNGGSNTPDTNGGCILLRNNSSKKEQQTDGGAEKVAAVSLKEKIKIDLQKAGVSLEQQKIADTYYEQNKALLEQKNNPVGWIITGLQKGWIADKVLKVKENMRKSPPTEERVKPPPPPPKPKPITKQEIENSKKLVEKFKSVVKDEIVDIEIDEQGFHWTPSNRPIKSYTRFAERGIKKLLTLLARNLEQPQALKILQV